MKKTHLIMITCTTLALLLAFAWTAMPASAAGKGKALEGTWRTQGAVVDCNTGAELARFQGLNVFMSGGSMLATGAANPAATSTGYGAWEYVGGRRYVNVIISFRFNTDGTLAGTQKITRHIVEVGDSGDEFTTTNTIEIIDLAGNVTATRCSTETGRRIEADN